MAKRSVKKLTLKILLLFLIIKEVRAFFYDMSHLQVKETSGIYMQDYEIEDNKIKYGYEKLLYKRALTPFLVTVVICRTILIIKGMG